MQYEIVRTRYGQQHQVGVLLTLPLEPIFVGGVLRMGRGVGPPRVTMEEGDIRVVIAIRKCRAAVRATMASSSADALRPLATAAGLAEPLATRCRHLATAAMGAWARYKSGILVSSIAVPRVRHVRFLIGKAGRRIKELQRRLEASAKASGAFAHNVRAVFVHSGQRFGEQCHTLAVVAAFENASTISRAALCEAFNSDLTAACCAAGRKSRCKRTDNNQGGASGADDAQQARCAEKRRHDTEKTVARRNKLSLLLSQRVRQCPRAEVQALLAPAAHADKATRTAQFQARKCMEKALRRGGSDVMSTRRRRCRFRDERARQKVMKQGHHDVQLVPRASSWQWA